MLSPPIKLGTNINACAKIIGITPEAFNLRGIYCLLPTTFLSNPPDEFLLAY